MSIGSAVFAKLTVVTDRQTNHTTPYLTMGRIYVRSTETRPSNSASVICRHTFYKSLCVEFLWWSLPTVSTPPSPLFHLVYS